MTQAQSQTTTINGQKFTMYPMDPLLSNELLIKVVKMVGPSFGGMLDSIFKQLGSVVPEAAKEAKSLKEKIEGLDLDFSFLGGATSDFFDKLSPALISEVLNTFAEQSEVTLDEKHSPRLSEVFSVVFKGDLGKMYKFLAWGMSVQWGKLLSLLPTGANF